MGSKVEWFGRHDVLNKWSEFEHVKQVCETYGKQLLHKPSWTYRTNEYHKFSDQYEWSSQWNLKTLIDPVQIAAEFYVLEGALSYALYGARPVLSNSRSNRYGLANQQSEIQYLFNELCKHAVPILKNYTLMIVGGELRHCAPSGMPGHRRTSWANWKPLTEKLGVCDALMDAELHFVDWSAGSAYCGPPWANIAATARWHSEGKLTDGMFIDRCMNLEHNGGNFLNKLANKWPINNPHQWNWKKTGQLGSLHAGEWGDDNYTYVRLLTFVRPEVYEAVYNYFLALKRCSVFNLNDQTIDERDALYTMIAQNHHKQIVEPNLRFPKWDSNSLKNWSFDLCGEKLSPELAFVRPQDRDNYLSVRKDIGLPDPTPFSVSTYVSKSKSKPSTLQAFAFNELSDFCNQLDTKVTWHVWLKICNLDAFLFQSIYLTDIKNQEWPGISKALDDIVGDKFNGGLSNLKYCPGTKYFPYAHSEYWQGSGLFKYPSQFVRLHHKIFQNNDDKLSTQTTFSLFHDDKHCISPNKKLVKQTKTTQPLEFRDLVIKEEHMHLATVMDLVVLENIARASNRFWKHRKSTNGNSFALVEFSKLTKADKAYYASNTLAGKQVNEDIKMSIYNNEIASSMLTHYVPLEEQQTDKIVIALNNNEVHKYVTLNDWLLPEEVKKEWSVDLSQEESSPQIVHGNWVGDPIVHPARDWLKIYNDWFDAKQASTSVVLDFKTGKQYFESTIMKGQITTSDSYTAINKEM